MKEHRRSDRNFVSKSVIDPNCLSVISEESVVVVEDTEFRLLADFLDGNVLDLLN